MADDIQSNININIDTSQALASIQLLQAQISAFHTQMSKLGAANASNAASMQQNLLTSINASGKFAASITTIKSSAESFTAALEKNKLSLGEYFRYAGASSKSFGKYFTTEFETINKVARERVKDLQTQYIKLGRDANGAMQAIKVRPLVLDMENLSTKTQIAAQRQQLLNQVLKQGSTNLLNFGKNTQWAGRQLMIGFTIPLTIMGGAAVKAYQQMEEAAVKFKRVYGDMNTTNANTDEMVKQVQRLALEYTKYGIAVKDTMDMAASAAAMGKQGSDLLQQISSANKLSALGGVDQNKALQTTISLTNAFSISSKDLGKNIDFLNAVENQTVLNIDDMTTAIPKAAPVIKQLGGNVKDLAFFLTAMKEGGVNASEGANALKSGLSSLINPTNAAKTMLQSLGINITGIVQKDKGNLRKTVIDFAQALDKLDPLQRAQAIEKMFGKFQFARISTLFQNITQQGTQASKVLDLANSSSVDLALMSQQELKKVQDSPLFQFKKAIADFQNSLAPIGQQFLQAVTPIIKFGQSLLDGFNNLNGGVKQFIIQIVGIVGIIGPVLLMTFGLIANGVANVTKGFSLVKDLFNKTGKSSLSLGEQVDYMTQSQIEAAAVASSLEQVHSRLKQSFTAEAAAVNELTAAYERSVAAQRAFGGIPAMPSGPIRKYATGGIIRGPGTGTSDSIVARLSNGEAVIPAHSVARHPDIVHSLISGNIPGFSKGVMLRPISTYTNAVGLHSAKINSDLNNGIANPQEISQELKDADGKILAPIIHEMATKLGAKSQSEIDNMIRNNPDLIQLAKNVSSSLAKELDTLSGKIGDPEYATMFKTHLDRNVKGLNKKIQKAAQEVLAEITTIEDNTKLRIRSNGKAEAQGRIQTLQGTSSYRGKMAGYLRTSELFSSGKLPTNPVLAHVTKTAPITSTEEFDKIFAGKNLTMATQDVRKRIELGILEVYQQGVAGTNVQIPVELIQQSKQNFSKTVRDFYEAAVSGIKESTKQASPSKEAKKVGENIGIGALQGIKSVISKAKIAGEEIGQTIVSGARTSRGANANQNSSTQSGSQTIIIPGDVPLEKGLGAKLKNFLGRATQKVLGSGMKGSLIGFAASSVLGMMSNISGPIGQISGQLAGFSTAISSVTMLLPLLGEGAIAAISSFAVAAAPAVIALGLLGTGIYFWVQSEKDRLEKLKAATAGYTASLYGAAQAQASANIFGYTQRTASSNKFTIGPNAPTSAKGISEQNTIDKVIKTSDFQNAYKDIVNSTKNISSVSEMNNSLYLIGLQNMAEGNSEAGAMTLIKAIQKAAGKMNVALNFKSLSLDTPNGQKQLSSSISQLLGATNSVKPITTITRAIAPGSPTEYNVSHIQYTEEDLNKLDIAAKGFKTVFQSLGTAVNDGTINLNTYNSSMDNLYNSIEKSSNSAKLFSTILKKFPSEIQAAFAKIQPGKNIGFEPLLKAAMMGVTVSQDIIDNLASGTHGRIKQGLKDLQDAVNAQIKVQQAYNQMLQDSKPQSQKNLDIWNAKISNLNGALDIISRKETKINKSYDDRIKALDDIQKANDTITQQQQDQLDLADALSKGDIAAAARAQSKMSADSAKASSDSAKASLEQGRQNALASVSVKDSTGKSYNRTTLESMINVVQGLIDSQTLSGYNFTNYKTKAATGGHIKGPGSGTSDSIPAMLSNGEYVVRANAVKTIGVNTLDKLNQADRIGFKNGGYNGYANGGLVGYKDGGFMNTSGYNKGQKRTQEQVLSMSPTDPKAPWNNGGWAQNGNDPVQRKAYWQQWGYKPSYLKVGDPSSSDIMGAAKTMAYFIPGVAAATNIGDSATALQNGDFANAGISAGFAALPLLKDAKLASKLLMGASTLNSLGTGNYTGAELNLGLSFLPAGLKGLFKGIKSTKNGISNLNNKFKKSLLGNIVNNIKPVLTARRIARKATFGQPNLLELARQSGNTKNGSMSTPTKEGEHVNEILNQIFNNLKLGEEYSTTQRFSSLMLSDEGYLKGSIAGNFVHTPKGGTKSENIGNFNVAMHREDENSKTTLEANLLQLVEEHQGKGLAKNFTLQSQAIMKKMGVSKITTQAGLTDGGYAWAKAGFKFGEYPKDIIKRLEGATYLYPQDKQLKELISKFETIKPDSKNYPLPKDVLKLKQPVTDQMFAFLESKAMRDAMEDDDYFSERDLPDFKHYPTLGEQILRGSNWAGYKNIKKTISMFNKLKTKIKKPIKNIKNIFNQLKTHELGKSNGMFDVSSHSIVSAYANHLERILYHPSARIYTIGKGGNNRFAFQGFGQDVSALESHGIHVIPLAHNVEQEVASIPANAAPAPQAMLTAALKLNPNNKTLQGMLKNFTEMNLGKKEYRLLDDMGASVSVGKKGERADVEDGLALVLSSLSGNKIAKAIVASKRRQLSKTILSNNNAYNQKTKDEWNTYSEEFPDAFGGEPAGNPNQVPMVHSHKFPISRDKKGNINLRPTAFYNPFHPRTTIHFSAYDQVKSHLFGTWNKDNTKIVTPMSSLIADNGKPNLMASEDTSWITDKFKISNGVLIKPYSNNEEYLQELLRRGLINKEDALNIHKVPLMVTDTKTKDILHRTNLGSTPVEKYRVLREILGYDKDYLMNVSKYGNLNEMINKKYPNSENPLDEIMHRASMEQAYKLLGINSPFQIQGEHGVSGQAGNQFRALARLLGIREERHSGSLSHLMEKLTADVNNSEAINKNFIRARMMKGLVKTKVTPHPVLEKPEKLNKGGLVVPKYFAKGGHVRGTDTVPAMLTPGEFVIKKKAVDRVGASTLNKINEMSGAASKNTSAALGDSVYNTYSINISVNSNSNPQDIANTVLNSIRRIDSQRIRSNRI